MYACTQLYADNSHPWNPIELETAVLPSEVHAQASCYVLETGKVWGCQPGSVRIIVLRIPSPACFQAQSHPMGNMLNIWERA